MDESCRQPEIAPLPPDNIRVMRWFAVFAVYLVAAATMLVVLLGSAEPIDVSSLETFQRSIDAAGPYLKLIVYVLYLSLASTFLPLNTGWIASAVAIRPGVTGEFWSTVMVVSALGAIASTMANLNDYHFFTLMLRSDRVAKIRHTRVYAAAERWFARSPAAILLGFNVLPLPLDPTRLLAASHRYSRRRFALFNFVGRFGRYAIIAAATFLLGSQGWIATVILLAIAMAVVLGRLTANLFQKRNTP